MTTVTFEFEEDIKIKNNKSKINVWEFIEILKENEIIPELRELNELEITPEIMEAYNKAKNSDESNFVNI